MYLPTFVEYIKLYHNIHNIVKLFVFSNGNNLNYLYLCYQMLTQLKLYNLT